MEQLLGNTEKAMISDRYLQKRTDLLEHHSKGQFSEIRYISKEVCRILRLWTQLQCLSRKADGLQVRIILK